MNRSIFITFIVSWATTAIVSLWLLYQANFNVANLIFVGRSFGATRYWENIPLYKGGYDGEFYFYIANDPFDVPYLMKVLDVQAHRYKRILYPILVWLLSLGQGKHIPFMMFTLNMMLLPVASLGISLLLKKFKVQKIEYFLAAAFVPSLLFALKYDLAEIIGMVLVIFGTLIFLNKSFTLAALIFLLASLTKEIYVLVPATLFCIEFIRNRKIHWELIISFCVYGAFWLWVSLLFQSSVGEFSNVLSGHFAFPGVELGKLIPTIVQKGAENNLVGAYYLLFAVYVVYLVRFIILISLAARKSRMDSITILAFVYGLVVLSYGASIWSIISGPESFIRVSDVFLVFSFLSSAIFLKDDIGVALSPALYVLVVMYFYQLNDVGIYTLR